MNVIGIIPARYGSTRLPGKPLIDINGKPMIQWVYERAKQSDLDDVIVACDDERIYKAVLDFGGTPILTLKEHVNGSSRIAEIAKELNCEYILNIQGDEPLINTSVINKMILHLNDSAPVVTLKSLLSDKEDIDNPNIVKVVTDKNNNALYFSRSPIPFERNMFNQYYKHIGLYGYQREFLLEYNKMKSTNLENAESLEQLRILENGYKIKVLEINDQLVGVDTVDDLEKVRELLGK